MNKEALACDPARWQRQTTPSQIEADLTFYGSEHGHSPEYSSAEGIFAIGYYYQVNPEQKTIYSLNPENSSVFPKDVREMFDTTTPRGQQEKDGFEKLTQLFFSAPPGSLAIWISPAGDTYPYPRIYMGQVSKIDESGNKIIEALDFNCDLNPQQLKALLKEFDPQNYLPSMTSTAEFLNHPLLLTPNPEKPIRFPEEILVAIKKLGVAYIHNIPIEIVASQIKEKIWQKYLEKSKRVARQIAPKIKVALDSQNRYQALFYMAQFEQEISRQGGFFAPQSSCGAAISSLLSSPNSAYYGLPAFTLEISARTKCPACGWPLLTPVPVGGHCPHCGTERKC